MLGEVVERPLVGSVVGKVSVVELRLEDVISDEAKNEDIVFCEVRTDDTVVDWPVDAGVDDARDDEAVVDCTLNLLLDASLTPEFVDKSLVDGPPSQG